METELRQVEEIYDMYMDKITEALFKTTIADRERDPHCDWRRSTFKYPISKDFPAEFLNTDELQRLSKRAFSTTQGYIGLVQNGIHTGDVVVVIYGARTPFVIRGVGGDRYQLIGDCYVHGIMDGEFLKTNPETKDIFLV